MAIKINVPPIKVIHRALPGVFYSEALQMAAEQNARVPFIGEWARALRGFKCHMLLGAIPGASFSNVAMPSRGTCLLQGEIVDIADFSRPNHVLPAEYVKQAAEKGDLRNPEQGLSIIYDISFREKQGEKFIYHPLNIYVQPVARGGGKLNMQTGLPEPVSGEVFDQLGNEEKAYYFGPDYLINRPLAAGNFYFKPVCCRHVVDGGLDPDKDKKFGVGVLPLDLPASSGKKEIVRQVPVQEVRLLIPADRTHFTIEGLPPELFGLLVELAGEGCARVNDLLRSGRTQDLQPLLEMLRALIPKA